MLKENKDKYKDLFRLSCDAMLIIEDNQFVDCNNSALEMLQYDNKEELLNLHPADLSPETQPDGESSFEKAVKMMDIAYKQGWHRFEWTHKRKDGTVFPVEVSLTSISNGSANSLHTVWRDISERKAAEEKSKSSNLKWQTTFDSITDSICLLDIDGKILRCNSATKKFSKIENENLEGLKCCDVFYSSTELKKFCPFLKMKESGKAESKLIQIGSKWTYFYAYPIFDESGNIIQAVYIAKDYTKQKQSEGILLKASRIEATTTLAAGVAHDFNNLMVGVLGNAELIKMKYKLESKAVNMLDNIIESALKAGDLSKQLLAFAKGGTSHPEVMNFNDIVQNSFAFNKISVPEHVKIEKIIEPDLWNIMADPHQMNQALMNLCINSIESIGKEGKITITTKNIKVGENSDKKYNELKEGNYVYVAVEDTGSGIKKDILAKIFEPFFSTKFLGRGLGLAAVFGIVKNNGGHISVDSEPDKGTSFKIFLPALDMQKIIEEKTKKEAVSGSETILIIDDDKMVIDVTKHILEAFGYYVLTAHSGYEAIDVCREYKNKIHIALLDIGMPVFGGTEAFPILKDARPDMKIIICSGYELNSETQALLDAGADGFMQKPFKAGSLMINIKNALKSNN